MTFSSHIVGLYFQRLYYSHNKGIVICGECSKSLFASLPEDMYLFRVRLHSSHHRSYEFSYKKIRSPTFIIKRVPCRSDVTSKNWRWCFQGRNVTLPRSIQVQEHSNSTLVQPFPIKTTGCVVRYFDVSQIEQQIDRISSFAVSL
jgi:hypothetical protein